MKAQIQSSISESTEAYIISFSQPWSVGSCTSFSTALSRNYSSCADLDNVYDQPLYLKNTIHPYLDYHTRPSMVLAGANSSNIRTLVDRGVGANNSFQLGSAEFALGDDLMRRDLLGDLSNLSIMWNHPEGFFHDSQHTSLINHFTVHNGANSQHDIIDPVLEIASTLNQTDEDLSDGTIVSGSVSIPLKCQDNNGSSTSSLAVDETSISHGYVWTSFFQRSFFPVDTMLFSNGPHMVYAQCQDLTGNIDSISRSIVVSNNDITPPQILIRGIEKSEVISSIRPVEVIINDDVKFSHSQVYIDDQYLMGSIVSPITFSFSPESYSPGDHTIRIKAEDESENSSELMHRFSIVRPTPIPTQTVTPSPTATLAPVSPGVPIPKVTLKKKVISNNKKTMELTFNIVGDLHHKANFFLNGKRGTRSWRIKGKRTSYRLEVWSGSIKIFEIKLKTNQRTLDIKFKVVYLKS